MPVHGGGRKHVSAAVARTTLFQRADPLTATPRPCAGVLRVPATELSLVLTVSFWVGVVLLSGALTQLVSVTLAVARVTVFHLPP